MTRRPGTSGFTLIEIIATLAIVGIIAGVIAPPLMSMVEAIAFDRARSDVVGMSEAALRRLAIDIRRLRGPSDISVAQADQFRFVDIDNVDVTISLDTVNHELLFNRDGTDYVLTTGAYGLTFNFYDDDHILLTSPVNLTQIRNVEVTLIVGDASAVGGSVRTQTQIRPMNLPHRERLFS